MHSDMNTGRTMESQRRQAGLNLTHSKPNDVASNLELLDLRDASSFVLLTSDLEEKLIARVEEKRHDQTGTRIGMHKPSSIHHTTTVNHTITTASTLRSSRAALRSTSISPCQTTEHIPSAPYIKPPTHPNKNLEIDGKRRKIIRSQGSRTNSWATIPRALRNR